MKIEQTTLVDYDEVDTDFRMKLPALFQRFQRAALHHSEAVGMGTQAMAEAGAVWILNRMRVNISRMPRYRETVILRTWHKGSAGFRAGRDFLVFCGDEKVAAATSRWIYYDLIRQRIAKIPKNVSEPYTAEAQDVLGSDAINFTVDKRFEPQKTVTITTREGDYDPNGHVNNTVYLEYLDTLIKRTGIACGHVSQVGIQYMKEIGREVDTIRAGVAQSGHKVTFRLFDSAAVYAAGFFTTGKPAEQ